MTRWTRPTATTACAQSSSPAQAAPSAPARTSQAGRAPSTAPRTFNRAAPEPGARHRDGGGLVALRLFDMKKPVIAAVNGPAVGFGATQILPMDMRLASTEARFGFVFSRRGVVMEAASSWFLPRLVGMQQAMEWVATGRVFSAEEALAGGLVRSLHAPEELLPAARALCRFSST